jgi:squalene-hopene/tetraprenyl-beta-curcumene cyclase
MSCSWAAARTADLHLRWDKKHIFSWRNFFPVYRPLAHWAERVHIRPLRKKALKKAEKWMLEHFERRMAWARSIRPC